MQLRIGLAHVNDAYSRLLVCVIYRVFQYLFDPQIRIIRDLRYRQHLEQHVQMQVTAFIKSKDLCDKVWRHLKRKHNKILRPLKNRSYVQRRTYRLVSLSSLIALVLRRF